MTKNKSVSAIEVKHFYSHVMNILVEVLTKNFGEIFFSVIKSKTKVFLEDRGYTFLDIEKNFTKTKFQIKLI